MNTGKLVATLFACCLLLEASFAEDQILIQADSLHVGDGSVLSPGQVLIQDGKITAVGESVDVEGVAVMKVPHLSLIHI